MIVQPHFYITTIQYLAQGGQRAIGEMIYLYHLLEHIPLYCARLLFVIFVSWFTTRAYFNVKLSVMFIHELPLLCPYPGAYKVVLFFFLFSVLCSRKVCKR